MPITQSEPTSVGIATNWKIRTHLEERYDLCAGFANEDSSTNLTTAVPLGNTVNAENAESLGWTLVEMMLVLNAENDAR